MSFRYRIDISRCIGCRACEVACVTANELSPEISRNWVPHLEADANSVRSHATFAPYLCHHCEDSPCVEACPSGASFRGDDGRVLVDWDLCIGCGLCVPACPYEARSVDPRRNRLEKCTLCEGRVSEGQAPACFEVCPAGARTFTEEVGHRTVSVGDPAALDEGHEVMRLVTAQVDPGPRLEISGHEEDLALLRQKRPPQQSSAVPSRIWRNGAGFVVQGLGAAAAAAMAGMVFMRFIRRRETVAAAIEAKTPALETVSSGEEA